MEGELALQYWIDKRPEFIAMTAKQENSALSAAKTAAELKELENRRDKLYSELENSYSKTATTDEEFKNSMQEFFKELDDFYAQIADKIENDKQTMLNKWRSEILSK